MKTGVHDLPEHLFDAMAAGGGGAEAVRLLAAAHRSKSLLLLRGMLEAAQTAGHSEWAAMRRGYDLLAEAQRHDPQATESVLTYPSVGAWALRTLRALRGDAEFPGATPAGLCSVAAAAAIRAGLPTEFALPVRAGRVVLPSLGATGAVGGNAVLRTAGGKAAVISSRARADVPADPYHDAPNWSGLHRVQVGKLDVLIDDIDPFRMPAVSNLAPRLPAPKVATWAGVFEEAWPALARHHPAIAEEVAAAVKVVVPIARPDRGVVSSSSPETFGAIALSEPPDARTLAVTLAHETQHVKLSILLDIVSLTMPEDGQRFYAPWREDPRPVSGLLQGAYAYLGVSRFWRHERHLVKGSEEVRAHAEFARWHAATTRVVGTLLTSGRLTPSGVRFVRGMERTLAGWAGEAVPEAAQALARHRTEQHLSRWQSANGPVPA